MPSRLWCSGWRSRHFNLLNVAVTRAKEVAYVVGNRDLWCTAGVFRIWIS